MYLNLVAYVGVSVLTHTDAQAGKDHRQEFAGSREFLSVCPTSSGSGLCGLYLRTVFTGIAEDSSDQGFKRDSGFRRYTPELYLRMVFTGIAENGA